jgi:hypothetical protein
VRAREIVMAEEKKFGPYKGSKANGGRPIYVYKKKVNGKWVTTSKNKARADYESKNGKLPRGTDVDHKDNNHSNDSKGGEKRKKKGNKKGPVSRAFTII